MIGKEDREQINGLLENVFTDANLTLSELWPEMNSPENEEYFEEQCKKVKEAISKAINTISRTITVYIDVDSESVDDAIEKVKEFLPHPTGDISCWEIDVVEAVDFDQEGD